MFEFVERLEQDGTVERALREYIGLLENAILEHYNQKADDLCWMDDNKLYEVMGLPPRDNTVGDPCAMLENCKRYIEQRCQGGGPWKSYADLEKENNKLRTALGQAVSLYEPENLTMQSYLRCWKNALKQGKTNEVDR